MRESATKREAGRPARHETAAELIASAEIGLALLDGSGAIQAANPALQQMLGYSEEELLSIRFPALMVEGGDGGGGYAKLLSETRTVARFQQRLKRKDGTDFLGNISARVVTPERNQITLVVEDVHARYESGDDARESQERFRLMMEDSQEVFFFECDCDYKIVYVSPSIEHVTGFSPAEAIGKPLVQFMADDVSARLVEERRRSKGRPERDSYVIEGKHKRGWVMTLEIFESCTGPSKNRGVRGFARDVTARKLAERQLQLSDQILQSINAIVLVANGKGQIIYVSPSTTRLLGFTAAELLGYGWWRHHDRSSELQREALEMVAAVARGERAVRTDVWEEVTYDKDGNPHWLLWQDTKGPGDLLIGVAQDITERKKMDEELSRRSLQLRAIFDSTIDGMLILDESLRATDANPAACQIMGREREQILGRDVGTILTGERYTEEFWKKVRSDGNYEGEGRIVRPDGTSAEVEVSFKSEILPGLHLVKVRDITDRKHLEQQFLQSQKMEALGRLAGGVAHDVNNMLMAIRGFLTTQDGQYVLAYQAVGGALNPALGLAPLQLGKGQINPPNPTGYLEMKANLNAGAAVGDPPYSSQMVVYDSLGASHSLTFQFSKTAANTWSYSVSIPAAEVGASGAAVPISTGTLQFDGNGQLISPAADVTGITVSGLANGASNLVFDWHLFNGGAGLLTQMSAASNVASSYQDGFSSGSLLDFSIGSDGVIQGSFTNGTKVLGQIALANFANLQGLQRDGHNCYSATLSSGQAVIGAPATGGRGTLAGGALELSNVDIAREFASLIVAQRGFQANARVVTAFDEITQDTINLKR